MTDFTRALAALPIGTFLGTAHNRRYVISKSVWAQGRVTKLVAEELGGADYISLNHFKLNSSTRLCPCEMPTSKVIAFVLDLSLSA